MAAKFTAGDSIKSTRQIVSQHPNKDVKARNTMNGMPGYINAHQSENLGHAKGGKGFGPHREGPVGEKGGSGAKSMGKAYCAPGTTTKNYKASSTDSAGALHGNSNTGAHHVHTGNRTHSMPGQKAPPTSKGILGGTVRKAGLDAFKGGGIHAALGKGSGGKMEKLKGHTQTSSEGRRKSMMY